ncbi:MAG TPA: hypothetical protein VJP02_11445 [Candidatus Sulfotelmatobacter sp.]|nr:hypothetical protein [Candidatus Sulfotelmatobacter sp.]
MNRTTLTAMGVVGIPDTFKPNVRIQVWFATSGIERQVVVAMPLDIVEHKTSFFFRWPDAPPPFYMRGVGSSCVAGGLLAQQAGGCDKNRSEYKESGAHDIPPLTN